MFLPPFSSLHVLNEEGSGRIAPLEAKFMTDQFRESGAAPWNGQTLEEVSGRPDLQVSGFMEPGHSGPSQVLLTRILELHSSGLSAEEIAGGILTTEPENVLFRSKILIEIILQYANRQALERIL